MPPERDEDSAEYCRYMGWHLSSQVRRIMAANGSTSGRGVLTECNVEPEQHGRCGKRALDDVDDDVTHVRFRDDWRGGERRDL